MAAPLSAAAPHAAAAIAARPAMAATSVRAADFSAASRRRSTSAIAAIAAAPATAAALSLAAAVARNQLQPLSQLRPPSQLRHLLRPPASATRNRALSATLATTFPIVRSLPPSTHSPWWSTTRPQTNCDQYAGSVPEGADPVCGSQHRAESPIWRLRSHFLRPIGLPHYLLRREPGGPHSWAEVA